MKIMGYIFSYLTVVFSTYALVKVYSIAFNKKVKLCFKNIVGLFLFSLITFIINNFSQHALGFILSYIVLISTYIFFFKDEKIIRLIFKIFLIYIILSLCDIVVFVIYCIFPVSSEILENSLLLKSLNSIFISLILILVFLFKPVVKFLNKLVKYVYQKFSFLYLLLAFFVFIVFLSITYVNFLELDFIIFLYTIFILSFFLSLCILLIFQYFRTKHSEEEQESLLKLMTDYEVILDKERENRHDMLNNLIALKTFKNKSSSGYEELLDDIIRIYEDKKSKIYANLYKMPVGIKGIIYYKMSRIKENNIDLTLLCAPKIEAYFDKLDQKLYFKICKILGIVLDNAIEAAAITENKIILIDIYVDDGLIVYIENSFKNTIDLNDINVKGISSKGKNRGYGLYIVNKLLDNSEDLEFNQNVNKDRFITVLKIKNPS